MSIAYSIDHDRRESMAVASGPVGLEDVLAHLRAKRREGGLSYPEIIDARWATLTWSAAEVHEIVDKLTTLGRESPLGPTALVVSSEMSYGMARMLEILLHDVCTVQPFRQYAAGERWLRALGRHAT
jgi:hypothetical protein